MSEDPTGFAFGDSNPSRYVSNQPTIAIDFNGLYQKSRSSHPTVPGAPANAPWSSDALGRWTWDTKTGTAIIDHYKQFGGVMPPADIGAYIFDYGCPALCNAHLLYPGGPLPNGQPNNNPNVVWFDKTKIDEAIQLYNADPRNRKLIAYQFNGNLDPPPPGTGKPPNGGNLFPSQLPNTNVPFVKWNWATAIPNLNMPTMHTRPNDILGTLPYISPEQLSGDSSAVDPRSDIYSLGVIALNTFWSKWIFRNTYSRKSGPSYHQCP
jgi:hypothetical protein